MTSFIRDCVIFLDVSVCVGDRCTSCLNAVETMVDAGDKKRGNDKGIDCREDVSDEIFQFLPSSDTRIDMLHPLRSDGRSAFLIGPCQCRLHSHHGGAENFWALSCVLNPQFKTWTIEKVTRRHFPFL